MVINHFRTVGGCSYYECNTDKSFVVELGLTGVERLQKGHKP